MPSHNTSVHNRSSRGGFTLLEIMISVTILTIILGLGISVSVDAYQGYFFRSERTIIISMLERARSLSMNNINETLHGLCYDATTQSYILFEGSLCVPGASANITMNANAGIAVSGLSSGVIFTQLSGTTSSATITISSIGRTADISINHEGRISW
jgi:prepilin-type N-terminal cleavage/methylation domain-containing protein